MAKLQESVQEPRASPPPSPETSDVLAALTRDVAATREDVAALRVDLARFTEEERTIRERAQPDRHAFAREALVSAAKSWSARWHDTIADVGRDFSRIAATARRRARNFRLL